MFFEYAEDLEFLFSKEPDLKSHLNYLKLING